ncbi:hypothetical protein FFLO_06022 [Filobasidium floriforme]|uniref:Uncharacterized protein n=1 Tax=Filobasidium floriforme TaxID=5210 RepID=A0A8K0JHJ9_9TREE|nr:hypothetical protein FFLO_06022 [Filobasidium floriforme]
MIRAGKAILEIQGWKHPSLSGERSAFEPVGEQECRSLGILEIDGNDVPASNQRVILGEILQKVVLPDPSVWTTLRCLLLPEVEIALPDLEALVLGCPQLVDLACKFTCPASNAAEYMTQLSDLLSGRVIQLDCETAGAGLLVFARHLVVCRELHLRGPLLWKTVRGKGPGWNITEFTPFNGAKVTHAYLSPITEVGRLYDVGEVAQTIKKIFPPTSIIVIRESIICNHDGLEQALFVETLRFLLKSLQREALERDASLRIPGWSKREKKDEKSVQPRQMLSNDVPN